MRLVHSFSQNITLSSSEILIKISEFNLSNNSDVNINEDEVSFNSVNNNPNEYRNKVLNKLLYEKTNHIQGAINIPFEKKFTEFEYSNNINNNILSEPNDNKHKIFKTKKIPKKKKRGRIPKIQIKSGKRGTHNKNSEDNIMKKLKAYIFKSFIDICKKNTINKIIQFKKFGNDFVQDVNVNPNLEIYSKKLKDILILEQEKVSTKYKKTTNQNYYKVLIKKIYQYKEKKLIKILELTFEELLIILRRKLKFSKDEEKLKQMEQKLESLDLLENNNKYKDINSFIENIRNKAENDEEYIKKIKELCCYYKNWFESRRKNKKSNANKKKSHQNA